MTDLPAETLLAALPLPALMIAQSGTITHANAGANALLGPQLTGRHYVIALRQPAILDAIEAVLTGAAPQTARYLGNDGARPTVWEATVTPVSAKDALRATVFMQNVTAVEEAGSMRRDFVANVSHELRTPLTALIGLIDTIRGPARDDPGARATFLDLMGRETQRMQDLIDDLLDLARVEDQERVRPLAPVDLAALVRASCDAFTPRAQARQMQFACDLPETACVPGDGGQLRQVLSNLIENAIKYGRAGSVIEITLGPAIYHPILRGPGLRLDIRDQGDGIAAHHLARLTERFFRVDNHRARDVGGTGLGLAIVKHIVNRHRGRLRMTSTRGQGSCFSVILPTQ